MRFDLSGAWARWMPAAGAGGVRQWRASAVAEALLGVGVLWSLGGVLLTPSMKFYYNMVLLFIYLPSLWLCAARWRQLAELFRRPEFILLFGLYLWALLSLAWSEGVSEPGNVIKRVSLFMLLVCGWVLWGRADLGRLRAALLSVGAIAGLYALAALIVHPMFDASRLNGFGGFLDNPNAAAYAVAFLVVMSAPLAPRSRSARVVWSLLLGLGLVYVAFCGSRGALLALMVTAVFSLALLPGRLAKSVPVLLLLGGLGLLLLDPSLTSRGDAERIELLRSSWALLKQHAWIGVGLGSDYQVQGFEGFFHTNSHNFPLHTALQYGVPALLVFLLLWVRLGVQAWRLRHRALGLSLLLIWVYASVAMQFDVFSLWERTRAMWLMPWGVILLGLCLPVRDEPGAFSERC